MKWNKFRALMPDIGKLIVIRIKQDEFIITRIVENINTYSIGPLSYTNKLKNLETGKTINPNLYWTCASTLEDSFTAEQ